MPDTDPSRRLIKFVHRRGIARLLNAGGGLSGRHTALVEVTAPTRRAASRIATWRLRHDGVVVRPVWDSVRVKAAIRHDRFRWRVRLSYDRAAS